MSKGVGQRFKAVLLFSDEEWPLIIRQRTDEIVAIVSQESKGRAIKRRVIKIESSTHENGACDEVAQRKYYAQSILILPFPSNQLDEIVVGLRQFPVLIVHF